MFKGIIHSDIKIPSFNKPRAIPNLCKFGFSVETNNIFWKASECFLTKQWKSLGYKLGVDRYVFLRANADTDYYRSSRIITNILNQYILSGVKMKINIKIKYSKGSEWFYWWVIIFVNNFIGKSVLSMPIPVTIKIDQAENQLTPSPVFFPFGPPWP